MEMADIIKIGLEAVLIPTAWFAIGILSGLKKSIEELNIKVAVVINRVDSHESRIGKLEEHK